MSDALPETALKYKPFWMRPNGTVSDVIALYGTVHEVRIQFHPCGRHVPDEVRDWLREVIAQ